MAEDLVGVTFRVGGGDHLIADVGLAKGEVSLTEIDEAIRHMPMVVDYITKKANEMLDLIEKKDDFRVIVSTSGPSRARAYVAPADGGGIHLEMADSVLLKAAAAMEGK